MSINKSTLSLIRQLKGEVDKISTEFGSYFNNKTFSQFVGLENQGATCYLNSAIQALFGIKSFREAVFAWKYDASKHGPEEDCIPLQLQILFASLSLSPRSWIETKGLTKSFGWDSDEAFAEHDVQEFYNTLFQSLQVSDLLSAEQDARTGNDVPLTFNSIIPSLFSGSLLSSVSCTECGHKVEKEEYFNDLLLPFEKSPDEDFHLPSLDISIAGEAMYYTDLHKSLGIFQSPELLDGENKWFCEKCNERKVATKRNEISRAPEVALFGLKRFYFDTSKGEYAKNPAAYSFPSELDLDSYGKSFTQSQNFMSMSPEKTKKATPAASPSETSIPAGSARSVISMLRRRHTADASSDIEEVEGTSEEPSFAADLTSETSIISEETASHELCSILMHKGSASRGHYFLFSRNPLSTDPNEWLLLNDNTVVRLSLQSVLEYSKALAGVPGPLREGIVAPQSTVDDTEALKAVPPHGTPYVLIYRRKTKGSTDVDESISVIQEQLFNLLTVDGATGTSREQLNHGLALGAHALSQDVLAGVLQDGAEFQRLKLVYDHRHLVSAVALHFPYLCLSGARAEAVLGSLTRTEPHSTAEHLLLEYSDSPSHVLLVDKSSTLDALTAEAHELFLSHVRSFQPPLIELDCPFISLALPSLSNVRLRPFLPDICRFSVEAPDSGVLTLEEAGMHPATTLGLEIRLPTVCTELTESQLKPQALRRSPADIDDLLPFVPLELRDAEKSVREAALDKIFLEQNNACPTSLEGLPWPSMPSLALPVIQIAYPLEEGSLLSDFLRNIRDGNYSDMVDGIHKAFTPANPHCFIHNVTVDSQMQASGGALNEVSSSCGALVILSLDSLGKPGGKVTVVHLEFPLSTTAVVELRPMDALLAFQDPAHAHAFVSELTTANAEAGIRVPISLTVAPALPSRSMAAVALLGLDSLPQGIRTLCRAVLKTELHGLAPSDASRLLLEAGLTKMANSSDEKSTKTELTFDVCVPRTASLDELQRAIRLRALQLQPNLAPSIPTYRDLDFVDLLSGGTNISTSHSASFTSFLDLPDSPLAAEDAAFFDEGIRELLTSDVPVSRFLELRLGSRSGRILPSSLEGFSLESLALEGVAAVAAVTVAPKTVRVRVFAWNAVAKELVLVGLLSLPESLSVSSTKRALLAQLQGRPYSRLVSLLIDNKSTNPKTKGNYLSQLIAQDDEAWTWLLSPSLDLQQLDPGHLRLRVRPNLPILKDDASLKSARAQDRTRPLVPPSGRQNISSHLSIPPENLTEDLDLLLEVLEEAETISGHTAVVKVMQYVPAANVTDVESPGFLSEPVETVVNEFASLWHLAVCVARAARPHLSSPFNKAPIPELASRIQFGCLGPYDPAITAWEARDNLMWIGPIAAAEGPAPLLDGYCGSPTDLRFLAFSNETPSQEHPLTRAYFGTKNKEEKSWLVMPAVSSPISNKAVHFGLKNGGTLIWRLLTDDDLNRIPSPSKFSVFDAEYINSIDSILSNNARNSNKSIVSNHLTEEPSTATSMPKTVSMEKPWLKRKPFPKVDSQNEDFVVVSKK